MKTNLNRQDAKVAKDKIVLIFSDHG